MANPRRTGSTGRSARSRDLMVVDGVEGVGYDEIVEIEAPDGREKRGQVLEVEEGRAVVQVFEGTSGLDSSETKVRFTVLR